MNPIQAVAAVFLLLLLSASASAAGQELTPKDFQGDWVYAGGEEEAKQRHRAIDDATENVPFFARAKVRSLLADKTKPAPTIQIDVKDGKLRLTRTQRTVNLTLGAKPAVIGHGEQRGMVSARFANQAITVESRGEKGMRSTSYSLSADKKKLFVTTRTTAKKLKSSVDVRSTYTRK